MGVLCTTTTVVVQGLFRTRTIRRSAVIDVTEHPSIRWRDAKGRVRRSPLTMFSRNSRGLSDAEEHRQGCLRVLRKTLRGRRPRYR